MIYLLKQAAAAESAVMEAVNHSKNSAMEAENHVKHSRSSKSHSSRGNFLRFFGVVAIALSAAVVMSCGDDDENGGDGNVQNNHIQVENKDALVQTLFADQTQGVSVTFTTTDVWTSSNSSGAWYSISQSSGDDAGKYTISINLDVNYSGEARSTVIVITCKGETVPINVTQRATTEQGVIPEYTPITIDKNEINHDMYADQTDGGSITFTTTEAWTAWSSYDLSTDKDASWLFMDKNSGGKGTHTITFTLEPNGTGVLRGVYFYIYCGDVTVGFEIRQEAREQDGTIPQPFWYCGEIPGTVKASFIDGKFTISGIGNMRDFKNAAPWFEYEINVVEIENGITSIGARAFAGCAIPSIVIPQNVNSIGGYAFYNCSYLTSVYSFNVVPPLVDIFFTFYGVNHNLCTLFVPQVSIEAYKAAFGWRDFVNIEAIEE